MFCPNCGRQIPDDSRFCEFCGSPVVKEQVLSAPQAQAPASAYTVQPAPKKRSAFPKAIILAAVFAVVAVGVWFLKDWLDGGKPVVYVSNQTPSFTGQSTGAELSYSASSPAQEQSNTQSGEGKYDVNGIEGITDIDIEADGEYITALFSTYDRPTLEEFGWYEDVFQNGLWSGATLVTELPYMLGGWKCFIVYDPYRNLDSYAQELANVNIEAVQAGVSLTIDWYQMYWEGEAPYDETSMEDTVYIGSYENGGFYLTGLGTLLTPDGNTADICLMR